MPADRLLRVVLLELAFRRRRLLPRVVDVQPREDRPLRGKPGAPVRQVRAEVEVRKDLELRRDRVERLRAAVVELAARERQHPIVEDAVLARDVERRFEARPLGLDERRRPRVELVGLLRGHPDEARGEEVGLRDPIPPWRDATGRPSRPSPSRRTIRSLPGRRSTTTSHGGPSRTGSTVPPRRWPRPPRARSPSPPRSPRTGRRSGCA